jgi:hypothetical protein
MTPAKSHSVHKSTFDPIYQVLNPSSSFAPPFLPRVHQAQRFLHVQLPSAHRHSRPAYLMAPARRTLSCATKWRISYSYGELVTCWEWWIRNGRAQPRPPKLPSRGSSLPGFPRTTYPGRCVVVVRGPWATEFVHKHKNNKNQP